MDAVCPGSKHYIRNKIKSALIPLSNSSLLTHLASIHAEPSLETTHQTRLRFKSHSPWAESLASVHKVLGSISRMQKTNCGNGPHQESQHRSESISLCYPPSSKLAWGTQNCLKKKKKSKTKQKIQTKKKPSKVKYIWRKLPGDTPTTLK